MSAAFPVDYHMHSRLCDGEGELADYVRSASERGLEQIGFSGHAPMPIASPWHMSDEGLTAYLETARALRARWQGTVDILIGIEADFLPGVFSPRDPRIAEWKLDYVIGSVHFLGALEDGSAWTVDGPYTELEAGIRESFRGDVRAAVQEYFRRVIRMIETAPPDIVGHLDLIKKQNRNLFDEDAPWYREAMLEVLEAVSRSECVVEINTGAISRGYRDDFYPALWFLERMARKAVPVTVGSDAHRPEHVAFFFDEVREGLRHAGYRSYWRREGRLWREQSL